MWRTTKLSEYAVKPGWTHFGAQPTIILRKQAARKHGQRFGAQMYFIYTRLARLTCLITLVLALPDDDKNSLQVSLEA